MTSGLLGVSLLGNMLSRKGEIQIEQVNKQ